MNANVISEKTNVPISVIIASIALTVPLTLWFGSIRSTANAAEAKNVEQQTAIETVQKDLSDIKADIREIKTVLKIKKSGGL